MDETDASSRYWCYMCSETVNPVIEIDTIECPICQSGFVEEMPSLPTPGNDIPLDFELGGPDSDRALSLWAPILLGMMGDPDGETEFDRELESIMRRRRRDPAAFLRLLHDMRARMLSESRNPDDDTDRERVITINPFDRTIVIRGSHGPNDDDGSRNRAPVGSLGDYFVGPGLDLLLRHLSENDPNMYGTPPARKEAVEALPDVRIEETAPCSVCLDECEVGVEVKEMPCKHKFHGKCILPWLEIHSSCPVCRYRLPCDESGVDLEGSRNNNSSGDDSGNEGNGSGRGFPSVPLPWPFSESSGGSSTLNSTSGSNEST